ncbi:hypothetical protein NPIL_665211 [Nephila pilipes]|uniref:Uncharacterized protein n=1 Tax=Nephila pilipes TaxID=299642 RepID=A0A8X6JNZ5_NEPPI|nr:hypothetical protein NPIL_665211 [Nephila pilipes]
MKYIRTGYTLYRMSTIYEKLVSDYAFISFHSLCNRPTPWSNAPAAHAADHTTEEVEVAQTISTGDKNGFRKKRFPKRNTTHGSKN